MCFKSKAMPPKGGIHQRLRAALTGPAPPDPAPPDPPPPEPHPEHPKRGGIQQRLGLKKRKAQDVWEEPTPKEITPEDDFRHCVTKKFLLNKASSADIKKEVMKATKAGARGSEDLARDSLPQNAQRSMMRALKKEQKSKGRQGPSLYYAKIPIHDPKTGENNVEVEFPLLLPHEVAYYLKERNPTFMEDLCSCPLSPGVEQSRDEFCTEFGIPKDKLFCMGVFGDGVPHQKHKSVECLTWNFLALGASGTRYLSTCIPKDFTCKCGCAGTPVSLISLPFNKQKTETLMTHQKNLFEEADTQLTPSCKSLRGPSWSPQPKKKKNTQKQTKGDDDGHLSC